MNNKDTLTIWKFQGLTGSLPGIRESGQPNSVLYHNTKGNVTLFALKSQKLFQFNSDKLEAVSRISDKLI